MEFDRNTIIGIGVLVVCALIYLQAHVTKKRYEAQDKIDEDLLKDNK